MSLRDYLYIKKEDRSALIVVLAGLLIVTGLIYWYSLETPLSEESGEGERLEGRDKRQEARGEWLETSGERHGTQSYYAEPTTSPERFTFDPNTADSSQLLRLGLAPWQVKNIYHFRAKGGVFRQRSDFARIYGLTQKQYRELEPYINISADYQPAKDLVPEASVATSQELSPYPVKLNPGEFITLNHADTTELKRVPGIGSYYARRIVSYGERLGGYASTQQLMEIEGFPEDALPFFQIDTSVIRPLNVNTLSLSRLRQHPYLNFYQARAIIDYRRLKGHINSLDDLRLLPEFPPAALERLRPYITFN